MTAKIRDLPTLLFVGSVGLHLGLSMGFPWVSIGGCLLAALLWVLPSRPAAPTAGLSFIVLVMGGLAGYFMLEEIATPGSWPAIFRVFAGVCLAGLALVLWLFWARKPSGTGPLSVIDRGAQNVLIAGLLLLLLTPHARSFDVVPQTVPRVSVLQIAGMVFAALMLTVQRVNSGLGRRIGLLLPAIALVPLVGWGLHQVQRPLIGLLFAAAPDFKGPSIGFSPYQRLDYSAFLHPSNRVAMRVTGGIMPGTYLVGNRLDALSGKTMTWEARQAATVAAQIGSDTRGHNLFLVPNRMADASILGPAGLVIQSLRWDGLMFLPPEAGQVAVEVPRLAQNSHLVWEPAYERDTRKQWWVGPLERKPDTAQAVHLQLPEFWDASLAEYATRYAATQRSTVVGKIKADFLGRGYSLEVDIDRKRPMHDFLLNQKPAFCFWYASGGALLLRANGIPTRLVSGYMISESIGKDVWLVRERDAHSWVEWLDEAGYWHTFDPTPPSIFGWQELYRGNDWNRGYHWFMARLQQGLDALEFSDAVENVLILAGFVVLILLFVREYRRIREAGLEPERSASKQWRKRWQRFLALTRLSEQPDWTPAAYAARLPEHWSAERRAGARAFLACYGAARYARDLAPLAELDDHLSRLRRAK